MVISGYLSEKIKILSFLLTILIVVLHANMAMLTTGWVSFVQEVMTAEVTRIAVPLFYLISGFLFFVNYQNSWSGYKQKLYSRTRSMLVPYFLFLCVGAIAVFIIEKDYSLSALWTIIKSGILTSPPIFYPLWFLRDLYMMVLFSPIIYWIIKKVPILLFVFFVVWLLGERPIDFLTNETIFFFSVGAFLTTKVRWLEQTAHKGTWSCFCLWVLLCLVNACCRKCIPTFPYVTHCIVLLLGIYAIWCLYDRLYPRFSDRVKSADIYRYSFFIYLLHEPILTTIKKIGLFVLGGSSWSIGVIYIIAPILTISIVYGLGLGLNTYLPQVLAFITGGRTRRR